MYLTLDIRIFLDDLEEYCLNLIEIGYKRKSQGSDYFFPNDNSLYKLKTNKHAKLNLRVRKDGIYENK